MNSYDAPNNIVRKLANLTLEPEDILCSPDRITTLHDLALDSLPGRILLVSWFFDQAVDFTAIHLEGALMKNGYYAVSMADELPLTHARVHGSCIVLFWQESESAMPH